MENSYFDTTLENNEDYASWAEQQDKLVLCTYLSSPLGIMSPSEVYNDLLWNRKINTRTPLTSIRRSISTLSKKGLLRKTEKKIMGVYGRPEYLWQMRNILEGL